MLKIDEKAIIAGSFSEVDDFISGNEFDANGLPRSWSVGIYAHFSSSN